MLSYLLNKTIKSAIIAAGGGSLALGAAQVQLVNADPTTAVAVAFFSVVFNLVFEWIQAQLREQR